MKVQQTSNVTCTRYCKDCAKQTRAWHTRLTEELTGMGFQPSAADPGVRFLERDNRRIFMHSC